MTKEYFLKPRYKVIADYPGSCYTVGEVLSFEDGNIFSEGSRPIHIEMLRRHPHLFKPLRWWEERDGHLPCYVSWKDKHVFEVKGYGATTSGRLHAKFMLHGKLRSKPVDLLMPATEEEYKEHTDKIFNKVAKKIGGIVLDGK
jgi:hypothetical protein